MKTLNKGSLSLAVMVEENLITNYKTKPLLLKDE